MDKNGIPEMGRHQAASLDGAFGFSGRGTAEDATVFFLDAGDDVRKAIKGMAGAAGLRVEICASLQVLLSRISRKNCHGCLVYNLPDNESASDKLLTALRSLGFSLPVIVLAEPGDIAVAVRAMKAGAFDFIEKPFSWPYLIGQIRAALKQKVQKRRDSAADTAMLARVGRVDSVWNG